MLIIFNVTYSNVMKIELYFISEFLTDWVVSVQPKRNACIAGLKV